MVRVSIFLIIVAFVVGMAGCDGDGLQNLEIWDWYDLDAVRDSLDGHHTLMNDLDSTTDGYEELASPTANGGQGWQPIGTEDGLFVGSFDGQGYEILDLVINRPGERYVGLFSFVGEGGVVRNIGVLDVNVTGDGFVGGLVGQSYGTVSNSHSIGSVTGSFHIGGLMGENREGTVSNSYFTGSVTGTSNVGGLVGANPRDSIVSNSYSTGSVTGDSIIGGLVGVNDGIVSNSYSTGSATGHLVTGGLVGENFLGTVSDSYSTGNVTGESYVGGLAGTNSGTVHKSYASGHVTGEICVGGLVGRNEESTVSDSFWDTETSGQSTSDGGTGKNTTEMKAIATFSGATWDIVAVANPSIRNPSYLWNIVVDETYPFLSWEP